MSNQAGDTQLGAGRKLRLADAVAQSVGFMGPVFSIAFLVPLVVGLTSATGNGAGNAAPLAVIIAAIGVLGFGWIVAEYARRVHAAGALYDYVSAGLGARAGGASGLLYYAGVLVLGAAALVMLGGTVHDTLASEFGQPLLPELGWDIVLLVIVGLTMFFGVALSTRAQLVLSVISVTVVVIFFVYIIVKAGGANDPARAFTPSQSPQGGTGVLFGVLYGVLLFTGFETSANLGEETKNPGRDIPRAVLFSILAVTGVYLLGSYAQLAGFHFDLGAMGKAAGAPLFALASPASAGGYGSATIVRIMELVVVLDMLAVLLGCATAGSRGLFALARDRRLPSALAAVSRRGTPFAAGITAMAWYAIVIVVTTQWQGLWAVKGTPHYAAMFGVLAAFGSFSLATIYFLLCVGAFRGLAAYPQRWKVVLAAVVGMLVTGAAVFGAVYKVTGPVAWVPVPAIVIFLTGLIVARKTGKPSTPVTTETAAA